MPFVQKTGSTVVFGRSAAVERDKHPLGLWSRRAAELLDEALEDAGCRSRFSGSLQGDITRADDGEAVFIAWPGYIYTDNAGHGSLSVKQALTLAVEELARRVEPTPAQEAAAVTVSDMEQFQFELMFAREKAADLKAVACVLSRGAREAAEQFGMKRVGALVGNPVDPLTAAAVTALRARIEQVDELAESEKRRTLLLIDEEARKKKEKLLMEIARLLDAVEAQGDAV